jgi:hypothetical protein
MQNKYILSLFYAILGIATFLGQSCRPVYAPAGMVDVTSYMPAPFPKDSTRVSQHYISGGYSQGVRYLPNDFNHLAMAQYHYANTQPINIDTKSFHSLALGGVVYVGQYDLKDNRIGENWRGNFNYYSMAFRLSYSYIVKLNDKWYVNPAGYMATFGIEGGSYNEHIQRAAENGQVSNLGVKVLFSNNYSFGFGTKFNENWQLDVQNVLGFYFLYFPMSYTNVHLRYKKVHALTGVQVLGLNPAWRVGMSIDF